MKIRREDLVAAAALGLLQRRQIGPLLLFLLQRDVYARRRALAAQVRGAQRHGFCRLLLHVVAGLAVATTALFAILLATAKTAAGGALFFFPVLYSLCAAALFVRFRKRLSAARAGALPVVLLVALPLALIAARQLAA